jgi:hypothetical protein
MVLVLSAPVYSGKTPRELCGPTARLLVSELSRLVANPRLGVVRESPLDVALPSLQNLAQNTSNSLMNTPRGIEYRVQLGRIFKLDAETADRPVPSVSEINSLVGKTSSFLESLRHKHKIKKKRVSLNGQDQVVDFIELEADIEWFPGLVLSQLEEIATSLQVENKIRFVFDPYFWVDYGSESQRNTLLKTSTASYLNGTTGEFSIHPQEWLELLGLFEVSVPPLKMTGLTQNSHLALLKVLTQVYLIDQQRFRFRWPFLSLNLTSTADGHQGDQLSMSLVDSVIQIHFEAMVFDRLTRREKFEPRTWLSLGEVFRADLMRLQAQIDSEILKISPLYESGKRVLSTFDHQPRRIHAVFEGGTEIWESGDLFLSLTDKGQAELSLSPMQKGLLTFHLSRETILGSETKRLNTSFTLSPSTGVGEAQTFQFDIYDHVLIRALQTQVKVLASDLPGSSLGAEQEIVKILLSYWESVFMKLDGPSAQWLQVLTREKKLLSDLLREIDKDIKTIQKIEKQSRTLDQRTANRISKNILEFTRRQLYFDEIKDL